MRLKSVSGREISGARTESTDGTCKACGQMGTKVLRVTMGVHVKEEYWPFLGQSFRFCWTPSCNVVYYNDETKVYFLKDELKSRVGIKEDAPPKPACYCMNVTEERIAEEILEKKCCSSLEDIKAYTKAGEGKWCLTTNPTGRCCREYLVGIIDTYLSTANAGVARELKAMEEEISEVTEAFRVTMKLEGLTCAGCVGSVTAALEEAGARGAEVSLEEGKAVAIVREEAMVEKLVDAVVGAGYKARILEVEKTGKRVEDN